MKTKNSLTVIGVFNIIMSMLMAFDPFNMIQDLANTDSQEAIRMVEVMHYGLFPAVLIIGLICLFCRNESIETAKKILLAYIIGTSILMAMFFTTFSNEPLMNFKIEMVIPDIIIYIGAIFGYFKAK